MLLQIDILNLEFRVFFVYSKNLHSTVLFFVFIYLGTHLNTLGVLASIKIKNKNQIKGKGNNIEERRERNSQEQGAGRGNYQGGRARN